MASHAARMRTLEVAPVAASALVRGAWAQALLDRLGGRPRFAEPFPAP
ncbi:MAG: hypothetical protein KGJ99_00565 [Betaproteobacteria bacterium]|nr:hypothetical protein [Betaproteobacteria bacterium]